MSEYSEGIVNVQQGYSEGKHKNKAKTSKCVLYLL